jgi:hypothetical protein
MVCGAHCEWLKEGGAKRGHFQQNLGLKITCCLTIRGLSEERGDHGEG